MPGKLLTLDASLNRIPEPFHTAEVMSLVDNVGLLAHPKALDFCTPNPKPSTRIPDPQAPHGFR